MRAISRVLPWVLSLLVSAVVGRAEELTEPLVVRSQGADAGVQVSVVPDYDRALRSVLISFPDMDTVEARPAGEASLVANVDFARAVHHELLAALPEYAEIGIILRAQDRFAVFEWSQLFDTHDNVHLHIVRDLGVGVDLWTQDLGEFVRMDGEGMFLASAIPGVKFGESHRVTRARERIAQSIFGTSGVLRADFVFEGGNLLFDRTESGLRVLVGGDVIRHTLNAEGLDQNPRTEKQIAERISRQFSGAEVIVVRGAQTKSMPHIDQAFIILRGGRVVINRILQGNSEEKRLLESYRRQLETLGYETLELETSLEDIRSYRNSVNAVPFRHRDTKKDAVIFPVFPGEVRDGAPTVLGESDLTGKAKAAFDLFRRASYKPLPIRDAAHIAGGNTHCITNVID